MEWLAQNWVWIAVAIGGFLLMTRLHGLGHGMHRSTGCGGSSVSDRSRKPDYGTAVDPVSRRPVSTTGSVISSVYRGRAYYFEDRQDREAFEANPEKYLAGSPDGGETIGMQGPQQRRPRTNRRGC